MKNFIACCAPVLLVIFLVFSGIFGMIYFIKSSQHSKQQKNTFTKEIGRDSYGFSEIRKYEVDGKVIYIWVGPECVTQINLE